MTKYKQTSYRLRELETLLSNARKGLLYDNTENGVLKEIKGLLKIWDSLDKQREVLN